MELKPKSQHHTMRGWQVASLGKGARDWVAGMIPGRKCLAEVRQELTGVQQGWPEELPANHMNIYPGRKWAMRAQPTLNSVKGTTLCVPRISIPMASEKPVLTRANGGAHFGGVSVCIYSYIHAHACRDISILFQGQCGNPVHPVLALAAA